MKMRLVITLVDEDTSEVIDTRLLDTYIMSSLVPPNVTIERIEEETWEMVAEAIHEEIIPEQSDYCEHRAAF